jgi:hypothetical protein
LFVSIPCAPAHAAMIPARRSSEKPIGGSWRADSRPLNGFG